MSNQIPEKISTTEEFLKEYSILKNVFDTAQEKFIVEQTVDNDKYVECIMRSRVIIKYLDELNFMQLNKHKDEIKTTYYISAELLSRTVGLHMNRTGFTDQEKNNLYISIAHLKKCLGIEPFHKKAMELFKVIFIYLTIFNANVQENINYLNQVLIVDPADYQLHYNFGFMFHRANKLESSLYHYKLAVGIIDLQLKDPGHSPEAVSALKQFKIKCLNGLGSIYFTIQDRDLALYYFELAREIDPNDPDVNNQIAVVYTEQRFTDKAIKHYKIAIDNYEKSHISTDKEMLIASLYMNMGLAKCYECNFTEAIDCYNKALKYKPRLSLAYQNKLLDVNYISHLIDDPMYIAKLHKNINKIYPQVISDYKVGCPNYKVKKDVVKAKSKKDLL
jgi:tetratricopeptide (TPR) repeat protein